MKNTLVIACENIRDELLAAAQTTGCRLPILFLPQNIHQNPDTMRQTLQSLLDRIAHIDTVLLPMGCCGNATKGLTCNTAQLVLPRCADCVDIFISPTNTARSYKAFYLTSGWLHNPYSIDTEFAYTLDKYGEETTRSLMQTIYGNYEGFVVLDTGVSEVEPLKETIQPLASMVDLTVTTQKASCSMLEDMLKQTYDDRFVVVPPGVTVSDEHLKPLA